MYKVWFAGAMSGNTAEPLTSAIPAKIAITVRGFFTDANLFSTDTPNQGLTLS